MPLNVVQWLLLLCFLKYELYLALCYLVCMIVTIGIYNIFLVWFQMIYFLQFFKSFSIICYHLSQYKLDNRYIYLVICKLKLFQRWNLQPGLRQEKQQSRFKFKCLILIDLDAKLFMCLHVHVHVVQIIRFQSWNVLHQMEL